MFSIKDVLNFVGVSFREAEISTVNFLIKLHSFKIQFQNRFTVISLEINEVDSHIFFDKNRFVGIKSEINSF